MRNLLFLSERNPALQSRRGALCVRDGDGNETLYAPRAHGLRAIILAGHGASITSEAVRWCGREGAALFLMERNGECIAVLMDAPECDGRRRALAMRERQWRAFLDSRKRLTVAGKIVRAKLQTLGLHPVDARGFRAELADARKLDDILTAEARAGAAYWMRWRGFPLKFEPDRPASRPSPAARIPSGAAGLERALAAKREQRDGAVRSGNPRRGFSLDFGKDDVPPAWRTFTARAGIALRGRGGTSKARHAATPVGAMMNYALAVALGQVTRAIIGAGLDPCIGFLHSPKPGRLSLSYDVLELLRADIAEAVFGFAAKRTFHRVDFEIDAHGIVRLDASLAREVAALALRVAPLAECGKAARRIAAWL